VIATPWRAGAGASRPVGAVPGLAAHCDALRARAGLLGRDPRSFALVGGALRAHWTGEPWADVDVAPGDDPAALVGAADFTVCQVAVHDGRLHHGPRFFADAARRRVVVVRVDARPLVTLLRMYKLAARGYAVPMAELQRVLDAARRVPAETLSPADVLRHGGGVVLP
jgi:hypothetical protein